MVAMYRQKNTRYVRRLCDLLSPSLPFTPFTSRMDILHQSILLDSQIRQVMLR